MARSSKRRRLKKTIAIVGEGETEWCYFQGFKSAERLRIKIKPELPSSTSLDSMVKKCLDLYEQGYDFVYCVLDMDTVEYDHKKKQKYEKYKRKYSKIKFIESMPCIELWFLQHFLSHTSTKKYDSFEDLKPDLKKYIQDYEKSKEYLRKIEIYSFLDSRGNQRSAIKNAANLLVAMDGQQHIGAPRTYVHEMIEELRSKRNY